MFRTIIRHFTFHRRATILLILCYMISILFISIGTSYLQEVRTTSLDNNLGEVDRCLSVSVKLSGSPKELIKYLLDDRDYDIKVLFNTNIKDKKINVYAHNSYTKDLWKPNVIYGEYLIGGKNILVGKDIRGLISNSDKELVIGSEKYRVTGTIGRKNRPVAWNNSIYMSLKDLYNNTSLSSNGIEQMSIVYLSEKSISENEQDMLISKLKLRFPKLEFNNESSSSQEVRIIDTIKGYMVFFILILTVSIVNITALSVFWIMDKTKEIGLRKALGFTNLDVIIIFLKEMLCLGLMAVILSLMIQIGVNEIVSNIFKLDLTINIYNFISAMILVMVVIILTAIIPVKNILKINIKEIINN